MTRPGPHGRPIPYFCSGHWVNRDAERPARSSIVVEFSKLTFIEDQWKERGVEQRLTK